MVSKHKRKPADRNERHSAAWGKRLSMVLALFLVTGTALGQRAETALGQRLSGETGRFTRMSPELAGALSRAKRGVAKTETVRVIVQYKHVPTTAHYNTMSGRGGRLHARLHMINGAAFTIPVKALPFLEADPEVASVTIDHPMASQRTHADGVGSHRCVSDQLWFHYL